MSDSPLAREDARTEILARVAAAGRASAAPESVERTYRRIGQLPRASVLALFSERLADYRASTRVVSEAEISVAVAEECTARAVQTLAVPSGVPAAWRPAAVQLLEDHSLDHHSLDAVDAVLTGCTVAVAETGTIALAGGPHEGRRALSLIPDLHICVVEQRQVVELLPDALATLGELVVRERRPITLISGPSATSDIELSRVEGVHGPRTLVVLIVTDQQESL